MGAGTKELPPESLPSLLSALEKGANGEMGNAFLGKHGWVHRWDVGHASNQTTSNFAHLLCCTFKFEPGPSCTYPTRSEKAGSRKTTHLHLGRSSAGPADDGGTVPANWQRKKKRHFVSGHRLILALRPPSSGDSTSRP